MLYHTTTILLFRPFGAHKQVAGITPSPWELCTSSANSIVALLKLYRSRFSLRYIVNLSVHMLFTASIVHLVNTLSSKESLQRSSKNALRTCMLGFSEIGQAWASATKSLHVVESLQRKWQPDARSPEKEAIPISTKKDILPQDEQEVNIVMPSLWQPNFTETFVPLGKVIDLERKNICSIFYLNRGICLRLSMAKVGLAIPRSGIMSNFSSLVMIAIRSQTHFKSLNVRRKCLMLLGMFNGTVFLG